MYISKWKTGVTRARKTWI